jgi:hypothetical protein
MKIKTNKGNWSGEEIEIDVNEENKTFNYYDYKVKLIDDHIPDIAYEGYKIVADNDIIGSVGRFTDLGSEYIAISNDYYREDENLYVAVVKLLSNIM